MAGAGGGQAELKVGVGGRIRGGSIDGVAAILVEKKYAFFCFTKILLGGSWLQNVDQKLTLAVAPPLGGRTRCTKKKTRT